MLNTGATSNFIDFCLAQQLGLIISDTPTVATMGNNTTDTVQQCVAPANIELGGVTTQLELLVIKNIPQPTILGFPWWEAHKANLNYETKHINLVINRKHLELQLQYSLNNEPPYKLLVTMIMSACKGIIPPI
ncbi:retrotransposon-like protein 1 [Entomophthora muscae]|uniref:Retrotransposon-like protein 1 n=1 Tax=Entomophthora muscae TaxID=34485 RepID=A0ACC2UNB7_9FUNG|nr:retrotransposon-like protein 1 [Entomophthora muscae]